MKAKLFLAVILVVVAACAGLVFAEAEKKAQKEVVSEGTILYVCNCGDHCKCNTVSTKPGKCACGSDLVPMHVLKIEKDEAILCTCGKDCHCKINETDPTKCGCGKAVKKVSLKGLYVCNCGAGCACNTVSDKPGKCKCGNELRKVE
ncbi:MAG: hypothetical protein WA610_03650 [Thermodesulfovibrionales bacterium]